MKISLMTALLVAVLPYIAYAQEPKLDDFHINFNTPADGGDVTTYIYKMDRFFMVKESLDRICHTPNQTTFSIEKVPIASIVDVYVSSNSGQFGVFVDVDETGLDEKSDLKVDCFGRKWPQKPRISTLILTGSDEKMAENLSLLIREEFGIE